MDIISVFSVLAALSTTSGVSDSLTHSEFESLRMPSEYAYTRNGYFLPVQPYGGQYLRVEIRRAYFRNSDSTLMLRGSVVRRNYNSLESFVNLSLLLGSFDTSATNQRGPLRRFVSREIVRVGLDGSFTFSLKIRPYDLLCFVYSEWESLSAEGFNPNSAEQSQPASPIDSSQILENFDSYWAVCDSPIYNLARLFNE